MQDQAVKLISSWVDWACLVNGELVVVFRNGDTATFTGSTEFQFQQLLAAPSPGKWINQMMKNWPYYKGPNPVSDILTPPLFVDLVVAPPPDLTFPNVAVTFLTSEQAYWSDLMVDGPTTGRFWMMNISGAWKWAIGDADDNPFITIPGELHDITLTTNPVAGTATDSVIYHVFLSGGTWTTTATIHE